MPRRRKLSEHDSNYIREHGIDAYLKYRTSPTFRKVKYTTIYEKDYHKKKAALLKKQGKSKFPRMRHGSNTKIGSQKPKRKSGKISNRVRIGRI